MDINFLGHSSFRMRTRTATVVTDPFDPQMVGLKFPKIDADIVTISHDHKDHNQASLVSGVKKVVAGVGEYEILEVSIIGVPSFHDAKNGALRGKNTIYIYETDGLRLAHLGDLGHTLTDEEIDAIGDIDILMIPCGGEYTIDSRSAAQIVRGIEPYFVIPMHYQMSGLNPEVFSKLEPVEAFLKEVALPAEFLPKFQIKKEEIVEGQNPKIIVLEKRS